VPVTCPITLLRDADAERIGDAAVEGFVPVRDVGRRAAAMPSVSGSREAGLAAETLTCEGEYGVPAS
jgi:hypothetical protein